MILALAYVILSAKPISIRRLLLLYILSFAMTDCLLSMLGTKHTTRLDSQLAIAATLAVWSYPLVRFLCGACTGHIALETFENVSVCVQATYGFAAAIALAAGAMAVIAPFNAFALAALAKVVLLGLAGGISFALSVTKLRSSTWSIPAKDQCLHSGRRGLRRPAI
jgi:hypothetical protein